MVFSESEVLRQSDPGPLSCGTQGSTIKLWYNDEHALILGVRRVNVKTASGITTTDYPITPSALTPTCVNNPIVGTTIAAGDQNGNDVGGGGGRPLWPALFITDLTVNGPTSRIGDWQQGGTGIPPHQVCGVWKGAVRLVDYTRSPVEVTVTPDVNPPKNNWTLGAGSSVPPGGFTNLRNEGYGAEVSWNVNSLSLLPGHTYRLQFMVHDGDQNKSGGDVGQSCTTISIPAENCITPLNLGNMVWSDANSNGMKDASEVGINNVVVKLYTDTNNNNIPDGPAMFTTTTNANGVYGFNFLSPGNYIVGVVIPAGDTLVPINGGDPDNNIDNDNNGITVVNGEAFSHAVTLALGAEPTNDGDNSNGNLSVDFGLKRPVPDFIQLCYVGVAHSYVTATQSWTVNTMINTATIRTVFSKNFVDNTYGTTRIGWPGDHKFSDLTGSDKLQLALYDVNGVKKLEFKLDYLSSSNTVPSGFKTLGVSGGDGGMITGTAANVLSVKTSLDANLNDFGYALATNSPLITNSPATTNSYAPNATYPNWIYDVWYDVTVSLALFPDGFGRPLITSIHASPSKTGSNTEVMEDTVCYQARLSSIPLSMDHEMIVDAYPNPFGDNITIDFITPLDGEGIVTITDITGRIVETFTNPFGKINTGGDLKPGVYFVNIFNVDYNQVIKIVKTGYDK